MPVSIRDIATRAGVSRGTVSKVLNGSPETISEETKARVRQAVEETGYAPNQLARSLGRRRTDTLGLMISGLQNPFFVEIMEQAERLALDAGYQVLVDAAPSSCGSYGDHGKMRGWPVDGVLMWASAGQRVGDYLGPQATGLPVVYLGHPGGDDRDAVLLDIHGGARMLAEWLHGRGYRRPAFAYPYPRQGEGGSDPRYRAYSGFFIEAGLPFEQITMARQEETRAAGLETGLALAARAPADRPDVVLCLNDVIAQGVYFGLRRAGLRVPQDMAVVGFDGIEEAQWLDTPLTSVRLPVGEMCRQALDVLARRMAAGASGPTEKILLPAILLPGGTA